MSSQVRSIDEKDPRIPRLSTTPRRSAGSGASDNIRRWNSTSQLPRIRPLGSRTTQINQRPTHPLHIPGLPLTFSDPLSPPNLMSPRRHSAGQESAKEKYRESPPHAVKSAETKHNYLSTTLYHQNPVVKTTFQVTK